MRVIALILLMILSLNGEIVDRSNSLSKYELLHLTAITESIQKKSGERIVTVFANEDDEQNLYRLASSFATELNVQSDELWILSVVSHGGRVLVSSSNELDNYFSETLLLSFTTGAEGIIAENEVPRAVEFLLLNIADVLAQKNGVELSALLPDFESFPAKKRHPKKGLIFLLGLLILIFAVKKMRRESSYKTVETTPLFGSSFYEGERVLFGNSFNDGEFDV